MASVSGINREQAHVVTNESSSSEYARIALIISSVVIAILLISVAAHTMHMQANTLPMQGAPMQLNYTPQIAAFISAAVLLAIATALSIYSTKQNQKPVLDLPPETPNIVAKPVAPPPAAVPKAVVLSARPFIPIISAPMPGKLVMINKQIGDIVMRGEILAVVEAMKMQNTICATNSGKITAVHAQAGEEVDANHPLFTIEKE
jgi:biotin carboxyl carrier protein